MQEGTNIVRVGVMVIHPFESLELQTIHNEAAGEEDALDGLVVIFQHRWQAEDVQKRLTQVGGVGRVKCTWYNGLLDAPVTSTPKMELQIESDGQHSDANGDVSMDDATVKEEELDVGGEDAWVVGLPDTDIS